MKVLKTDLSLLDNQTVLNQFVNLIIFLKEAQSKFLLAKSKSDKKAITDHIEDLESKIALYKDETLSRMDFFYMKNINGDRVDSEAEYEYIDQKK